MKTGCIVVIAFLCFRGIAQCGIDSSKTAVNTKAAGKINLKAFGNSIIFLKDGSIKKNCHIIEIKNESIVYLKQKVLHDLLIDKIKQIESTETSMYLVFTSENDPVIKYKMYKYHD